MAHPEQRTVVVRLGCPTPDGGCEVVREIEMLHLEPAPTGLVEVEMTLDLPHEHEVRVQLRDVGSGAVVEHTFDVSVVLGWERMEELGQVRWGADVAELCIVGPAPGRRMLM